MLPRLRSHGSRGYLRESRESFDGAIARCYTIDSNTLRRHIALAKAVQPKESKLATGLVLEPSQRCGMG